MATAEMQLFPHALMVGTSQAATLGVGQNADTTVYNFCFTEMTGVGGEGGVGVVYLKSLWKLELVAYPVP